MRILITVQPLMYREAIALAIHNRRPDIEVLVGPEESLDGEVKRFAPHLLVRNDTDGADMERMSDALCWVEILYSDSLSARVSLDGEVWEIEDICMADLISIIEQTERLIPDRMKA
jgi:hypothetical protein